MRLPLAKVAQMAADLDTLLTLRYSDGSGWITGHVLSIGGAGVLIGVTPAHSRLIEPGDVDAFSLQTTGEVL
jgi:hypothetical protein